LVRGDRASWEIVEITAKDVIPAEAGISFLSFCFFPAFSADPEVGRQFPFKFFRVCADHLN